MTASRGSDSMRCAGDSGRASPSSTRGPPSDLPSRTRGRSRMRSRARTDLCGGCRVTGISTANDRSLKGRAAGLPERSAGVPAFAGRCRSEEPSLSVAQRGSGALRARARGGARRARACWREPRTRGQRCGRGVRRGAVAPGVARARLSTGRPRASASGGAGSSAGQRWHEGRSPPQGGYSPPETAASMGQERLGRALTR